MLRNIGTPELIVIAIVIIIFFGTKRVPDFIRSISEAIREFRRAVKGK